MAGWRYFATRLNGDGTETYLAGDLPLKDVQISQVLSGVDNLDATVPVEHDRLRAAGVDYGIFVPWSTAVYAELDGVIRAGGIVVDVDLDGPSLKLSCDGFTGYLSGMPYGDVTNLVQVDPLKVAGMIWGHVQSQPGGNLGIRLDIDPPTSPIRLGLLPVEQWPMLRNGSTGYPLLPEGSRFRYTWPKTTADAEEKIAYGVATRTFSPISGTARCVYRRISDGAVAEQTKTTATLPAGWEVLGRIVDEQPQAADDGSAWEPYKLEWFADFDLGQRWADLAQLGRFDYWVEHAWGDADGITAGGTVYLTHTLHVVYGGIGRRREDLRFVVGENVQVVPAVEVRGVEYADEIITLGAGEGRAMVRGTWRGDSPRLRRPKVVTDKLLRTTAAANRAAATEGARIAPDVRGDVKQLVVRHHPNAPLGSWQPGDQIRLVGAVSGWASRLDLWVRVLETQISPDTGDVATLTVTRSERAAP
ncbi:hypothetical protein G9U51_08255 [Calidifontibacter sp. DB0510]|uniref:Minor tail protein n=1 Tax=Metallococcus carri TaxID=1656884 RepID=A0A967B521_9MICO|nr:hypothetical protein [Metallococcus carri]NHN55767.1 hypothetical protein [Metallococcus carri]NOP38544.1 hypothetical protein [Calidifontibacter sp. DB2511S]